MWLLVFVLIGSAFANSSQVQKVQTIKDSPHQFRYSGKDRLTAEREVTEMAHRFCQKYSKQLKIKSMDPEVSSKPKEEVLAGMGLTGGKIVSNVFQQGHEGGGLGAAPQKTTQEIFDDYYRKNPKARKAKPTKPYTALIIFECE